jgi:hypothetical protein
MSAPRDWTYLVCGITHPPPPDRPVCSVPSRRADRKDDPRARLRAESGSAGFDLPQHPAQRFPSAVDHAVWTSVTDHVLTQTGRAACGLSLPSTTSSPQPSRPAPPRPAAAGSTAVYTVRSSVVNGLRPEYDTNRIEARIRCTTQVCTTVRGYCASIASGSPVSPSQHTMSQHTKRMSRHEDVATGRLAKWCDPHPVRSCVTAGGHQREHCARRPGGAAPLV